MIITIAIITAWRKKKKNTERERHRKRERERESLLTFTNPSKTTCKSLFDLRPIFWDTRYFTPNQAESLYHGEPSCTHAFKYKMMLLLWRLSVMVTRGQCTTWRSQSLSRSNTWLLSPSWNPSAHLALVFKLWRHPPSDVRLTPAISPIMGRLMGGGSNLLLSI